MKRTLIVDIAALVIIALGLGHLPGQSRDDAEARPDNVSGSAAQNGESFRPRPSCFAGTVRVGPRAGALDFRARCHPTAPSGDISVAVSRVTLGGSKFVLIRAFRRFPSLKGSGGVRRSRCVRARGSSGQILCRASVEGSAVLEGRIWVAPEERCETDVQLVSSPSHEQCRGVCASIAPPTILIASGRPRGC
jgi:hypothetical protein